MGEHTPGPWEVRRSIARVAVCAPRTDHKTSHSVWSIANYIGGHCDARLANAHLISAAPDLLAVLKAINAAYDGPEWQEQIALTMRDVRAAIAKAEGRQ